MSGERAVWTAGALAAHLASFPPETEIVMETPDMEYRFLRKINPPCGDEDAAQRAICLVGGTYT